MLLNIVMPNVNITFPKVTKVNQNFTYSDLHLDLTTQQLITNESAKVSQQRDITVDYDLGAIRNSIVNLFLTSPGDKILNPLFGMDLRDYLFMPTSVTVAQLIKDTIVNNITVWEPRVSLTSVDVIPDFDNQQYTINMYIGIPFLQINEFILSGYINSQGYAVFA